MTFGAFVAVLFDGRLGMAMIVAAVLAMVATAILSLGLEGVLWRPLRARRAGFMSLFLASIGLALVLRQAIFLLSGPQVVAVAVAAVAIVTVALVLRVTSVGRTMRAVADDRALAAVSGIDTGRVIGVTWILCGLIAGLAGVLSALVQGSFDPNFGFSLLLPVFAAVVLGGIGSAYGALLGGLVLGLATEVSTWSGFHGGVNPVYKPVVAFAVLIAVLLLRPQGLLGRARIL